MSELPTRAADPTLDAFWRSDEPINYAVQLGRWPARGAPSVAHRVHWSGRRDEAQCEADAPYQVTTQAARWFAVPCRECFPDAPPPGFRRVGHTDLGVAGRVPVSDEDPGLSWQVPS